VAGQQLGPSFSSGTLWGTLHPVVSYQAISITIVPLLERQPFGLASFVAYELIQINLQVSGRVATYGKAEYAILC
jgi:hypothetical protein